MREDQNQVAIVAFLPPFVLYFSLAVLVVAVAVDRLLLFTRTTAVLALFLLDQRCSAFTVVLLLLLPFFMLSWCACSP